MYAHVAGTLNSQMTCSVIRPTAGAYASAKANRHALERPCTFRRARALFLVGVRGRDADFRTDGMLSVWTVAGRKRLSYSVPAAFTATLATAKVVGSLTVIERRGRLLGRVTVTLDAPDPSGVHPVGVDLYETNALVAVDPDGKTLFVSGKAVKVADKRNDKTRKRLQRKLATHKAEHRNTHSVRRVLNRLGRKRSHRRRTFAQKAAKQLLAIAPTNAVLLFEALSIPQPRKGTVGSKATRRRLALRQRALIRQAAERKAQETGIVVAEVNPAYTSQTCSRCGLCGVRKRHAVTRPLCGYSAHADLDAAANIRNRYMVLRDGGQPDRLPGSSDSSASRASHTR